jgi:SAM-dependent methyltransferase
MIGEFDWETYWRWELFRRACDPVDFRRWKRDSQRELKRLYADRPDALLLDSTCGLGDHTVNLAEEGFRVEACDLSPIARDATCEAVRAAGLDVPVFEARWEELGTTHRSRYDVIFNDVIHWIGDEAALEAALRGMFGALKPGGALVYFFADEREGAPGEGIRSLEWDWAKMERAEIAWDHARGNTRVTLTVMNERGPDFIDQHHLYAIREGDAKPRLDTLTQRRWYRWDWHALTPVLARAGFTGMHSRHFRNVKGYEYAMNFAYRE